VHLATAGHTSRHGFALTIVEGLKARHAPVKAERIIPIRTEDYPTKAVRPRNSRLDLGRLTRLPGCLHDFVVGRIGGDGQRFGITGLA
jgi:dTDP-4-dehydrorhamnose reductase